MMKSMKKASYILAVAIISVTIGHGITAITQVSAAPMSETTYCNSSNSKAVNTINGHNSSCNSSSAVSDYIFGKTIHRSGTEVGSSSSNSADKKEIVKSNCSTTSVSTKNASSLTSTNSSTKNAGSLTSTNSSTKNAGSLTSTNSSTKKSSNTASTQLSKRTANNSATTSDTSVRTIEAISAYDIAKNDTPYNIEADKQAIIAYGESRGLHYNPNLRPENTSWHGRADLLIDVSSDADIIAGGKADIDGMIRIGYAGADFNPYFEKKSNKTNDYYYYGLYG